VPSDRVPDAVVAAEGADGILALGGGSAIDLGKAISA
jgi:alcohol dehydrogenase class IV